MGIRILHVGWCTIEYRRGGGSIIHVESLMEQLARRGIHTAYFCGGRYNLLRPAPFIKQWRKPTAVVYEVVNSPNLITSHDSIPYHVVNDEIEGLFLTVLERERPDLIHFHELESPCGSLLSLARLKHIPYVVDIHNYWYLSHQRDLFDMTGNRCDDFRNGEKCLGCEAPLINSRLGWMYVGYLRNTLLGRWLEGFAKAVYREHMERG